MGNVAGTGINETNERLSRSLSAYQPNLADNVFKRQPTIELFKSKKKTYSYGTEVKVKFRYTKGGKSGSAGGIKAFQYYDTLNTAPTDTIKTGRALWKNLAVPLTYSHEEMWENNSKNQLPLLKTITDAGESLLSEELNDELWGIQGAAADMVIEPITSIVSGSDAGTIHGLSKASNTWLYSQEVTSVGDLATNIISAMRSGKNLAIDNSPSKGDKIDAWLMDRATYEGFEDIHPTFLQYTSNKAVDLGFEEMIYSGTKVRFDSSIPLDSAGNRQVFGLNLKYWEMAVHTEVDFMTTKFYDMMPKQAVSSAQIMLRWCIINNNPRTNVRLSGITL
jgi:hypothetical protein